MSFFSAITDFVDEYQSVIDLAVVGGTTAFAYYQQQEAISASEQAQNQALAFQQTQIDRENEMNRLKAPINNASQVDLFSSDTRRKLTDFLYEPKATDRTDVGLSLGNIKKAIGVA